METKWFKLNYDPNVSKICATETENTCNPPFQFSDVMFTNITDEYFELELVKYNNNNKRNKHMKKLKDKSMWIDL